MAINHSTSLPVIDYSRIIGHDDKAAALEKFKLYKALSQVGFIYLSHHGIPSEQEKSLFEAAHRFFALPEKEKVKVESGESKGFHGWFSPARTSGGTTNADQKEAFDVGNDADATRPNQWPVGWPELRNDMNAFFERCHDIHLNLLSGLAEQVGAPPAFFQPRVKDKDHFFRIIYYPETVRQSFEKRFRATPHTDYGTLTLLFNDDKGGLQVKTSEGEWVNVPPIPGCAIVNVGDLLARWFNDTLKSTEHRVVDPPAVGTLGGGDSEIIPRRYSIAWFGHPNRHQVVEPLEVCCTANSPSKYEPVQAGHHVIERLAYLHKKGRNAETWSDKMQREQVLS